MTNRDSLAKHYTSCQIFLFGKFHYKLDKNACYLFKRSLVFVWESLIGLKGSLPPATLARADGLLFPHLVQLEGYSSRDPWPLEHMNNFRTEHCTSQFYFLILFNPLLSGSCKHVLWIKVATVLLLGVSPRFPKHFLCRAGGKFKFVWIKTGSPISQALLSPRTSTFQFEVPSGFSILPFFAIFHFSLQYLCFLTDYKRSFWFINCSSPLECKWDVDFCVCFVHCCIPNPRLGPGL